MIKKCSVCRSTKFKQIAEGVLICEACETIESNLTTEEALQRASSKIQKAKVKKAHGDTIRVQQETNTKKPYLRFQFRVF